MVHTASEKRQGRYLIGFFLISILLSCESKKVPTFTTDQNKKLIQSNLSDSVMFRQTLIPHDSLLKVEVSNYTKSWLIEKTESVRGIPVIILSDTLVEISYFRNKSELYYCVFSYYTLLNDKIPVLVYDDKVGYLNIETTDYSKEFLKHVAPYLNDDMIGSKVSEVIEIDGELRPVDGWTLKNNPITYNPRIRLLKLNVTGFQEIDGEIESHSSHNCDYNIELEKRYREVK